MLRSFKSDVPSVAKDLYKIVKGYETTPDESMATA